MSHLGVHYTHAISQEIIRSTKPGPVNDLQKTAPDSDLPGCSKSSFVTSISELGPLNLV